MRASASGATGDAIRTAVSRLDHRLGQRRLTGKGRKAARQLCWFGAPTSFLVRSTGGGLT